MRKYREANIPNAYSDLRPLLYDLRLYDFILNLYGKSLSKSVGYYVIYKCVCADC